MFKKGKTARQTVAKVVGNKWFKHASRIGRTAFDVYIATRQKSSLMGGAAILSAVDAIANIASDTVDLSAVLEAKGYTLPLDFDLNKFIWHTFENLNIPKSPVSQHEIDGVKSALLETTLPNGARVCFVVVNGVPRKCYTDDKEAVYVGLLDLLRARHGRHLLLSVMSEGWSTYLLIGGIDLDSSCFVSSVAETKLVGRLQRLREMGHSRSMLLVGPPGVGKTTLAGRVAKQLDGELLAIDAAALSFICQDRVPIEPLISALSPEVLLLDDIDRLGAKDVKYLLGLLERINRSGINTTVFSTVNDLDSIPEAMRRPKRHDEIVVFKPPDLEDRIKIIKEYCEVFGTRLSNALVRDLAVRAEGLTGAYLEELAKRASIFSKEELYETISHMLIMRNLGSKKKDEKPTDSQSTVMVTDPTA